MGRRRVGYGIGIRGSDLRGANLRGADMHRANLRRADLSGADLRGADLVGADLVGADLMDTDLTAAELIGADLRGADFRHANMRDADLHGADLADARLIGASLRAANLYRADLAGAELIGADLTGANLIGADLADADLTDAVGLLDSKYLLNTYFERAANGWIVYKSFGLCYSAPSHWAVLPGEIIEENVDPDRRVSCTYGINFGTREWMRANGVESLPIWKCLIRHEWLDEVIVPYGTDGKARCGRLELLHVIDAE